MKLIPTTEQQNIISAAKERKNLSIKAFAGASKTSICVMIAEEIKKPSLYVAFNKSIADEAKEKFPSNVECRTIHSLAYGDIISKNFKLRKKLQNFYQYSDIENLPSWKNLKDDEENFETKSDIIDIIKTFCQSSELSLENFIKNNYEEISEYKEKLCKEYWKSLIDENSLTKLTPDVYLKLFQLKKPVLDYQVIYVDEFQDTNPVVVDIILRQKHAQLICVGDPWQSIYEWRGAINAFELLSDNFQEMFLTESFRFTQEIADLASKLLSIGGEEKKIIGKKENKLEGLDMTKKGFISNFSKAYIVRNNSTLLSILMDAAEKDEKVYCLADLKPVWGKLYHIQALYFKEKPKYPDKELSEFKTYNELLKMSEKIPELKKLIKFTQNLSSGGLANNINKIKSILVENEKDADYVLTTGHKSKGLEWDEVILCGDLFQISEDKSPLEVLFENQTLNLLYVAITRGRYRITLPFEINNLLEEVSKV